MTTPVTKRPSRWLLPPARASVHTGSTWARLGPRWAALGAPWGRLRVISVGARTTRCRPAGPVSGSRLPASNLTPSSRSRTSHALRPGLSPWRCDRKIAFLLPNSRRQTRFDRRSYRPGPGSCFPARRPGGRTHVAPLPPLSWVPFMPENWNSVTLGF